MNPSLISESLRSTGLDYQYCWKWYPDVASHFLHTARLDENVWVHLLRGVLLAISKQMDRSAQSGQQCYSYHPLAVCHSTWCGSQGDATALAGFVCTMMIMTVVSHKIISRIKNNYPTYKFQQHACKCFVVLVIVSTYKTVNNGQKQLAKAEKVLLEIPIYGYKVRPVPLKP